ncbi:MAG: hypothetical protein U1D67_10085, partial [Dehalococcoidia bacterium]|nr:hypothetical protein [Dehalococcoidia bacterium]
MLKKCGVGLLAFIGALMFGVCTVNTVLVDSVMATSHEQGEKDKPEQSSRTRGPVLWEKVVIAKVPAVVKAAIDKETAGGTIREIMEKEVDGKLCYAVKYVKDGMEKTTEFTEEGAVVASEGKKVDIAQVPAVVKAAIEKETAGGTIGGIVKHEADGKVCYAVEYVKDGVKKTLKLTEAGAVVASDGKKVDIAQVPAVVKAAIEKETAGGTIGGIVKHEADGKVCYAVEYVKDGMKKTLKLTEAGAVVASEDVHQPHTWDFPGKLTEEGDVVVSDGKKADIAPPQSPEGSAGGFGGVESNGKKVDIAQVPAVVKAAIEKETAGGTIGGIVKHEADGKVC